jgi:hypothetical protein
VGTPGRAEEQQQRELVEVGEYRQVRTVQVDDLAAPLHQPLENEPAVTIGVVGHHVDTHASMVPAQTDASAPLPCRCRGVGEYE